MIQDSYSSRDVDKLMQQLRDDDLGPGDEAKLQDIIRNHPEARRRFVRQLAIDAQLKDALELSSVSLSPVGTGSWLKGWPVIVGILIAVVAVALPTVMKVKSSSTRPLDMEPPEQAVSEKAPEFEEGIALARRQIGVVWEVENTSTAKELNDRVILSPGFLKVESGVLRIDFYSGASVLLRGPARFEIVAADCGRLYAGVASVEVPPPAAGFRMETQYEVIDLGSRYAVKVREDEAREVHVFDGKISIQDQKDGELILNQNEAAILNGSQTAAVYIEARPQEFPSGESLNLAIKSQRVEWEKLRNLLKKDPDVVLYYTFEKGLDWVQSIPNEAQGASAESNGAVVGCNAVEGRWPGKKALGFKNSSNRVRFNLPGEFENLTLQPGLR